VSRSLRYEPHLNCAEIAELTGMEFVADCADEGPGHHPFLCLADGQVIPIWPGQWVTRRDDGSIVVSDEDPEEAR
jgi:hypothetical protein